MYTGRGPYKDTLFSNHVPYKDHFFKQKRGSYTEHPSGINFVDFEIIEAPIVYPLFTQVRYYNVVCRILLAWWVPIYTHSIYTILSFSSVWNYIYNSLITQIINL